MNIYVTKKKKYPPPVIFRIVLVTSLVLEVPPVFVVTACKNNRIQAIVPLARSINVSLTCCKQHYLVPVVQVVQRVPGLRPDSVDVPLPLEGEEVLVVHGEGVGGQAA